MTKVSDKINVLLQDWIAIQQSRLVKMGKYKNVRVRPMKGSQRLKDYYAIVKVGTSDLRIVPDDEKKDAIYLDERRIKKYDDFDENGIIIYRKFSKLKWKLHFKSTIERDAALRNIRNLTGDGTTDSSSSHHSHSTTTTTSGDVGSPSQTQM